MWVRLGYILRGWVQYYGRFLLVWVFEERKKNSNASY
jgi:hypothetical protein